MRKVCSIALAAMMGVASPALATELAPPPAQCPFGTPDQNGQCIDGYLIIGAAAAAMLAGLIVIAEEHHQSISP